MWKESDSELDIEKIEIRVDYIVGNKFKDLEAADFHKQPNLILIPKSHHFLLKPSRTVTFCFHVH
jgi:hypothetical protein